MDGAIGHQTKYIEHRAYYNTTDTVTTDSTANE